MYTCLKTYTPVTRSNNMRSVDRGVYKGIAQGGGDTAAGADTDFFFSQIDENPVGPPENDHVCCYKTSLFPCMVT